jgi:hypothetical protein
MRSAMAAKALASAMGRKGRLDMELHVHYPETDETKEELEKIVARVHADLITGLLYSLTDSEEQIYELLSEVKEEWLA